MTNSATNPTGLPLPAVDRLLLIAGFSTAGKSTLHQRLVEGSCPDIAHQIRWGRADDWTFSYAGDLESVTQTRIGALVVHYDLFVQSLQPDRDFLWMPELISHANQTTVITLCTPLKTLRKRIRLRQRALLWDKRPFRARVRNYRLLQRKARFYRHPQVIINLYRKWFELVWTAGPPDNWIFHAVNHNHDQLKRFDPETAARWLKLSREDLAPLQSH